MSDAHVAMLDACGGRFRVLDESEVAYYATLDPAAAKADGVSEAPAGGEAIHYVCARPGRAVSEAR